MDTLYLGNNHVLGRMAEDIDSIGVGRINSVRIVSQSSPEGHNHYNHLLSKRRAATMRSYMESRYPKIKERLTIVPDGESWRQLRQYVAADRKLKDSSKERVLKIIDDDSVSIDVKKQRLTADALYRYLYATYYPVIRNSRIQIVYQLPIEHLAMPKVEFQPCKMPSVECHIPQVYAPKRELFLRDTLVVAAKSNLLYDAVTALNFEVEVPIRDHWSIAVENVFPWWEKDNKYCLQMWEMGVEGRYWFRRNANYTEKLRGHFIGAYAMSAKFDFQNDYDICYQGEYWSAGVTYGYALKLTRHLNMEFSISVGWLSSSYRHYYPAYDYGHLWADKSDMGRINYFGPTKLKVALVWPIRIPYKKRWGGR